MKHIVLILKWYICDGYTIEDIRTKLKTILNRGSMPNISSIHVTKEGLERLKKVRRKLSAQADRDYSNEEVILFLIEFYETEELPG